jgi:hypothetical protein
MELNKLTTIVRGLKEQVREIEPGTYNDLALTFSAGRIMLDQPEAKKLIIAQGLEVPTFVTEGAIVISPVAGKK